MASFNGEMSHFKKILECVVPFQSLESVIFTIKGI